MKVFIVHAHPEPQSFCGAMKETAVSALTAHGHEVRVSDLYAMGFDPVAGAGDFAERSDAGYLKVQAEQMHAFRTGRIAEDIAGEQEKLFWADALILEFPLWWFSLPAALKGWIDRVFTMGRVYGGGVWYSNGALKGRRAMLAMTTGGPEAIYGPRGINGDFGPLLFHIHHGMLYFCGFTVLPPFVAWSAARVTPETRAQYLEAYAERLLTLDRTPPMGFHPLEDYDERLQLKPGMKP